MTTYSVLFTWYRKTKTKVVHVLIFFTFFFLFFFFYQSEDSVRQLGVQFEYVSFRWRDIIFFTREQRTAESLLIRSVDESR